jgi:Na+/melibiose symporter-like transporter
MKEQDDPGGKKVGKIAPWVLPVSIMTGVAIIAVGMAVLSNRTEKAIAVVVALIVELVITVVGGLLTFKQQ